MSQSTDYFDAFKKLYYHLYSNSNASRAERIIGDLSKLLLVALGQNSSSAHQKLVESFLAGKAGANNSLLQILHNEYGHVFASDEKFHLNDTSLRYGFSAIAHLDLKSAKSHLLGEAFQALIGPNLRGDKGQFFTPRSIVRCMIEVLAPDAGAKVVDPACGTAGFLTETASYWEREKKTAGRLIGLDKDSDLYVFSSALLSLTSAAENGRIINTNSLDIAALERLEPNASPLDADFVLTNPPFGSKISIKEPEILAQYDLGHVWEVDKSRRSWKKTQQLRSAEDPQILFIELCVRLLRPGGAMAIVLPEGVFGNSGTAHVLDYLRSNGAIYALIDCPRTAFQPGTDTKTNILFFKKSNNIDNEGTKIAVALTCGHDRRGRTTRSDGSSFPDDFSLIAKDWKSANHDYWFESKITNPHYLVPRYYDRKTFLLLEEEAKRLNAAPTSFGTMISRGWITIRKGHEVGSEAYGTGEIPFVRTSDISNFEVSIDPTKCVSEEIYGALKNDQGLKPGSILMVVDGRYRIGRCAILHEYNFRCVAQSHLRIINVSENAPFSPFELLYLLNLSSVQRDIRSLVFIQSTLGSLGSRVKEIKVPIPLTRSDELIASVDSFTDSLKERARLLDMLTRFDETAIEI